jgi:hypothetical protein
MSDRKFLELYDQPILNDDFYCLDHGPIDSSTLDLIKGNGSGPALKIWADYLTPVDGKHTFRTQKADYYFDELSDAEEKVLKETVERFKKMKPFEIVDWIHENCSEWNNPKGGSTFLSYTDVFKALGKKNPNKRNEHVDRTRRQHENIG